MPNLSSHVNIYSSAIALLDLRGWSIKIDPAPYKLEDSRFDSYEASRDGTVLLAATPLDLLALAAIHEYHHPHPSASYWWRIESAEPGLMDRLEDEALEQSFLDYLDIDEGAALKVIEDALSQSKDDPGTSAEDRVGISRSTLDSLLERFPHLKPNEE